MAEPRPVTRSLTETMANIITGVMGGVATILLLIVIAFSVVHLYVYLHGCSSPPVRESAPHRDQIDDLRQRNQNVWRNWGNPE